MKKIKILISLFALTFTNLSWAQDVAPTQESIEIAARIQYRIMTGQADSSYAGPNDYDAVDFNFRRIRLKVKYSAEWYGGLLDIKGENLLSNGKSAIQEAHIWIKPGFLDSKMTFGQFKLPFLKEEIASSGKLMLPERYMAVDLIQQQDIGFMFAFNPLASSDSFNKKLLASLSVTNGDGSGHSGTGRKAVEADSAGESLSSLVNWRLEYAPIGALTASGKEIFASANHLSLGVAGAMTEGDEYGDNTLTDGLAYQGLTADLTAFFSGVYGAAEYTTFSGDAVGSNQFTYSATLGYMMNTSKLAIMPVFRYNYFQQDDARDGKIDDADKVSQIWVGTNLFLDSHNLKVQVFYQIVTDSLGQNGADLADNVFYCQLQADFGKKL